VTAYEISNNNVQIVWPLTWQNPLNYTILLPSICAMIPNRRKIQLPPFDGGNAALKLFTNYRYFTISSRFIMKWPYGVKNICDTSLSCNCTPFF